MVLYTVTCILPVLPSQTLLSNYNRASDVAVRVCVEISS